MATAPKTPGLALCCRRRADRAGREPKPGIVLEKKSGGIIGNKNAKMWPFLSKRPFCNHAWGLVFPGPQFPDLQNERFGQGDPANSFQLQSPVTETKASPWLHVPVLGQPQDLRPDMKAALQISRQMRALSVQLVPISCAQGFVLVLGAAGCHHVHSVTCSYQPFVH